MKASAEQPVIFNSISELMRRLEQPKPVHPLVALVNYGNIKVRLTDVGQRFVLNFYKISFKTDFKGQIKYGQGYYDFEEGGLAFLAPHQVVTTSDDETKHGGYTFFFHPDFIRDYPLSKSISKYGFFSYAVSEALSLSDKEQKIIAALFDSMAQELENNIDHFSQDVMVSQIELLLNYSNRFYNRQFITRKAVYNDLIDQMDAYLSNRFETQQSLLTGLPSVQEVSDHLKVSSRYLTDMLKSLTGQSTQQHIHSQLIEKAKDILSTSNLSIAEIAYQLGFEHPQSFNKLFRQKTKVSPVEFRQSFNN
jgi:AraC-like DNA-binding protein